jgi:hypothetical protein
MPKGMMVRDAHRMGLEGIVSKRIDSRYQSGPSKFWLKTKTATWRAANHDRWELFEKRGTDGLCLALGTLN